MTCVIGARGIDGCVIVSDTREVTGSEHRDVSKIRNIWNNKGAIACAGEAPLICNIVETINEMSKNRDSGKIVKDIVDDNVRSVLRTTPAVTTEYPPVPREKRFEAIFIGLQGFDKGESYIRVIHDQGFSTPIENFEIIGIGHRYIRMLFTLFYDPKLKVNELAVLGYFCIATLISLDLDDNVGTGQLGPEAVILRTDGEAESLNRDHLDPDFKTARASSKSLKFRNKLMKSIWNKVPQAFEKGR